MNQPDWLNQFLWLLLIWLHGIGTGWVWRKTGDRARNWKLIEHVRRVDAALAADGWKRLAEISEGTIRIKPESER